MDRAKRRDFAKVREVIRREMAAGRTLDQAIARAAEEEPEYFGRIQQSSRRR